ncbi:MAG: hypothetical protein JW966_16090 [Anaerolineae bacterium]|nr:hypothetical protein [Anaerolineae bacterium]
MGFLKNLFGGGKSEEAGDRDGLYFYIRSDSTGEVIRLRIHRYNDLSQADDSKSYYVRKTVVGQRSYDRIEVELYFDKTRRFNDSTITGGELVDRDAYETYQANQ